MSAPLLDMQGFVGDGILSSFHTHPRVYVPIQAGLTLEILNTKLIHPSSSLLGPYVPTFLKDSTHYLSLEAC